MIEMGKVLAIHHIRLIYGGGGVGLMGVMALSAQEWGGDVVGIIPEALMAYHKPSIGDTVVVQDLHSRKKKMSEDADAFIALPG
jgi:uncharacterized protein (TIGR00730 family)